MLENYWGPGSHHGINLLSEVNDRRAAEVQLRRKCSAPQWLQWKAAVYPAVRAYIGIQHHGTADGYSTAVLPLRERKIDRPPWWKP